MTTSNQSHGGECCLFGQVKSERILKTLFLDELINQMMDFETNLEIDKFYYANSESGIAAFKSYELKHKLTKILYCAGLRKGQHIRSPQ